MTYELWIAYDYVTSHYKATGYERTDSITNYLKAADYQQALQKFEEVVKLYSAIRPGRLIEHESGHKYYRIEEDAGKRTITRVICLQPDLVAMYHAKGKTDEPAGTQEDEG